MNFYPENNAVFAENRPFEFFYEPTIDLKILGKMMTKAKMSNALKIRKSYLFISRLKLTNWFDDFGKEAH